MTNTEAKVDGIFEDFNEVVFKPLTTLTWKDGAGGSYPLPTSKISRSDIREDNVNFFPSIFQSFQQKSSETRALFCGDKYLAGEITEKTKQKHFDWRMWPTDQIVVKQTALPSKLAKQCCDLLSDLGLGTGVFDFIKTPSGEYYFLEVNAGGNFLSMQVYCPDLCLKEFFTNYILDLTGGSRE